jgi:DNA-binding HxlR family transcriptional regulator
MMSKKYLALKDSNDSQPQVSRLEKAAEAVSSELDKVIHERLRLGIISSLAANDKLSFSELKALLNTFGRQHQRACPKARGRRLCNPRKSFRGRVPLTEYKITARGRKALVKYLDHMEALIKAMKKV